MQLEIEEENIYNEIAIRYDVFIEYEYLSHYLTFPKHSIKEKFNERREWLLNKWFVYLWLYIIYLK